MTSINTNIAAQTALRTLQSTNAQLDQTQSRISTGLKIGEAKDNAAYWSISTSLKSDNKALGAVKDSLGLGAATVDTAYQGLNRTLDVLDEIKSKIMTAQQSGLPRSVIQAEISELQKQLKSIADSSIFSGENWLSINSDAAGFSADKEVVASFTRDANNAVSIGKVGVNISDVALFDSSAAVGKNGILDGAIALKGPDGRDLDLLPANADGNATLTGGVVATTGNQGRGAAAAAGTARSATSLGGATPSTATFDGGVVAKSGTGASGTLLEGNTVTFSFGASGAAGTITVNVTADMATAGNITWADVAAGTVSNGANFTVSTNSDGDLIMTNVADGATAVATIDAITVAQGAHATAAGTATYTTEPTADADEDGAATSSAEVSSAALTLSDFAEGDVISFTLGGTDYTTEALDAAGANLAFSDIVSAINAELTGVTVAELGGVLTFTKTANAAAEADFDLSKLTATNAAGSGKTITNGIGSEETAGAFETNSFAALTLDADDNIYFKIGVDGGTAKEIVIDRALINETLERETGAVANAGEWKQVVDAALEKAGVTGVTTEVTSTDKLTFTSATAGAGSGVSISAVDASAGADTVSVMTLDISDAGLAAAGATNGADIRNLLSAYVAAVSETITKVTNAAATLGSVASRIEIQQTFVSNLMDTIDKGISGLVDADMNEESTRLQALQVKQQLGVQALSIANQSAQNVLRLFQ